MKTPKQLLLNKRRTCLILTHVFPVSSLNNLVKQIIVSTTTQFLPTSHHIFFTNRFLSRVVYYLPNGSINCWLGNHIRSHFIRKSMIEFVNI